MEKDQFVREFKSHLRSILSDSAYRENESYIDEIAPSYWDDKDQRGEGPKSCAEAEASEWGEE